MSEEVPSSVANLMFVVSLASLVALFHLLQKHNNGEPLLPYESRKRVPWAAGMAIFGMALPIMGVTAFFLGGGTQTDVEEMSVEKMMYVGWGDLTFKMLFVLGAAVGLSSLCRADAHDLGLPTSWRQLRRDIGIGAFAALASLVPIYAVQLMLFRLVELDTAHPLVEQLQENHSPAMMLLGFAMAVIAAPLFEEFTFRGLLQGWLERREDEVLAFDATRRRSELGHEADGTFQISTEPVGDQLADDSDDSLEVEPENEPAPIVRPPYGWLPELPHGWTPVLISGLAFGLAHVGHGVAPIPLVLFGIVLGYLYQRTHRLVPSITAHMLFNGYSMVLLWLQLK